MLSPAIGCSFHPLRGGALVVPGGAISFYVDLSLPES